MKNKIINVAVLVAFVVTSMLIYYTLKKDGPLEEELLDSVNSSIPSKKTLVAVFDSYSVNADEVLDVPIMDTAKYIKNYTASDLFEIKPVKAYAIDYDEFIKEAQAEFTNEIKPEITGKITNFEDYEVVFLGYPLWWDKSPLIIESFLDSYDFKGKKVIPFNVYPNEEVKIEANLATKLTTNNFIIKDFKTKEDELKVNNWLQNLGF